MLQEENRERIGLRLSEQQASLDDCVGVRGFRERSGRGYKGCICVILEPYSWISWETNLQKEGRHILLLLDNAPAHIVNEEERALSNVNVAFLPPNTTSKIQPMDAGIIAAFKRRYRKFHLQNAIDREERGETELYKVDQLTAMHWCRAAWDEVSMETIANCFQHTGILGTNQETLPSQADAAEQAVEQELQVCLSQLPLRDPMSVDQLINPPEENRSAHIELTDDEIVALVRESAEAVDDDEEEQREELNQQPRLSKAEKLRGLGVVAELLDVTDKRQRDLHKLVRQLQKQIRAENAVQSTLDGWFS